VYNLTGFNKDRSAWSSD